jgi:hypothetical protein
VSGIARRGCGGAGRAVDGGIVTGGAVEEAVVDGSVAARSADPCTGGGGFCDDGGGTGGEGIFASAVVFGIGEPTGVAGVIRIDGIVGRE